MSEIKPCPYCHSDCSLEFLNMSHYVVCSKCGASGPIESSANTAVELHNEQIQLSPNGIGCCRYCGKYCCSSEAWWYDHHQVQCNNCGSNGPIGKSREDAI